MDEEGEGAEEEGSPEEECFVVEKGARVDLGRGEEADQEAE